MAVCRPGRKISIGRGAAAGACGLGMPPLCAPCQFRVSRRDFMKMRAVARFSTREATPHHPEKD
jgi:hypothetical protein